jgi:hypothetical protein
MSTIISDLPYQLNLDPKTRSALAEFSRRRRFLLVLRSLAAGIVVLLASMLLIALCDYLWFLSDSVRWLMSLTGYVLAAAVMWRQGLGQLGESDPKRLARQLESAEPRLREDLLSAVELADPELLNGSEGFRERLQRRVGHRIAGIDIGGLLPIALVRYWFAVVVVGLVICGGLLLIPQVQFARRIARAMLPGMAIERASLTEVTIVRPSPPSGIVAQGDAVAVIVELSGRSAEFVTLRWRTDEGVEGETEMTARVAATTVGSEGTLPQQSKYAANLSIGSVPIDYQILAGDAITLWHTLTPRARPRVTLFEKRYVFPHYAKLDDRVEEAEHGDLQAIMGTMAEVTVHFDEPVAEALLRFANHAVESPLEVVDGSGQVFRASIPIKTPSQYQIDATSVVSGLNNPFSPQFNITPVIDSHPVARWSQDQPNSSLLSPLDVVSLAAVASDDLPIDQVIQEYIVNTEPMIQRAVAVNQSSRDLEVQWKWDLMHRSDDPTQQVKLAAGDIVRTRVVAVDRRGQRGESRWIEFLITDEGFDADRHQRLQPLAKLTNEVSEWTLKVKALTKQVADVGGDLDAAALEKVGIDALQLQETAATLVSDFVAIEQSSRTLPEAATLELSGRALIELDLDLSEMIGRLTSIRRQADPSWDAREEKLLREVAADAKRLGTESTRLDQWGRAAFGQQLAHGVVADAISLRQSLRPMLDEDDPLPAGRFPRYLTVAVGRLEAITWLIQQYEDALPDSTRRHYESWDRWEDSWSSRLKASIEDRASGEQRRALVKQFDAEFAKQINHAMVDGQMVSTLNNMLREIENQIGPASDRLRRVTKFGEAWKGTTERASQSDDSRAAAILVRDAKLAESDWNRSLAALRNRLALEERLHRSRPVVDLQYAADLKLLDRAIENVTDDGFQPYRDEIAAQVHQKLANAFQLIEAKHRADGWHGELVALIDAERRLESNSGAKVMHPWWLERYSVGMQWPVRYFRNLAIPSEEVEPIEGSRYSEDYNQARNRITARRWSNEKLLTADAPLTSIERDVSDALAKLEPRVAEARATIQQYVLTLAELARDAAEKADEAKQRTQSRTDDSEKTADQLDAQQQQAEQAAERTIDRLVDVANTSDITDSQQRELAHDADAAAAQIQDALDRADQQMEEAAAAESDQDRSEALDQSATALEDLSEKLRQTAQHFEQAEAGGDLAETREQLRQAEQSLQNQDDLQQRYDDAQEMADAAQSDPQELLEQLEQELQTNRPMQQELSDIAQRAAEAAQRTLEQAERDETALNQSLERSDATFQERKRRVASQLANLAQRASAVDQSLLDAAEKSIGWANQPEVRPKLAEARGQLREAVDKTNRLGGENALLSRMTQAAAEMTEAVSKAVDAVDEVQEQTSKGADTDIHADDAARNRAKQQVERFGRDARNRQVQSANNQKRTWDAVRRDAGRRVQQTQRQKRDAQTAKRKVDDRAKREPKNSEALQKQAAEYQRRIDDAARAEAAAKQTSDLAAQKTKATEQRIREVQKQKSASLDKPNPAAQLAAEMSKQASNEFNSMLKELSELSGQTGFDAELRVPENQAASMATQQQRIQQDIADAAEQLQRAARHEDRLGQNEIAEQLEQAAEMIAESAIEATAEAAQSLQESASDAGQSPEANQKVGQAREQIAAAAAQLAELMAADLAPPSDPSASSQQASATESEAEGQQMARTLDELDRALAEASQPPSPPAGQQPESGQQASDGQPGETPGQPGSEGQQPGDPSGQPGQPTAADASPTLAGAMDAQSQQAARQRMQQFDPSAQGNQPGDSEQKSASNGKPGPRSGAGEMPRGGIVDTTGTQRIGSDWGQLRERRTDDATESQGTQVAPQYRREIEAYFRAVARRAAEKP